MLLGNGCDGKALRYGYGAGERHQQPPPFKGDPRTTQDLRRRTEIMPGQDSHTRIKPLILASGHGRYYT
jgi:hypothetical protein